LEALGAEAKKKSGQPDFLEKRIDNSAKTLYSS
jgi:hypothetical protein